MGNKDEKTFTDLFSSSTKEPEVATKTFSDILNSNNTEEKKEVNPTITFDSLFDNLPSKEPEITINPTDIGLSKQSTDTTKIENREVAEPTVSLDFNSLFETKIETKNSEIKQENVDSKQQGPETSQFNPFFEDKNEQDEIVANSSEESNNSKKILNEENKVETNSEIEQKKNNEIDFSSNPFMNNEVLSTEIKKENSKADELKIEENPFFDEISQIEEKNAKAETKLTSTSITPTPKETTPPEASKPISTSPFFEEEKKNEENPFFQNQLNLIENQEAPKGPSSNIDTTKSKHYNIKVVKKKEPLIKFILGVLSYALFIFLLLIGITLLVYVLDIKIRAAKGDYSSPTFNAYVVLTGSMLPEIQVKDVVVTKKVDAKDLKEGDVITFASADSRFLGTIITHRIIKKNPPTETEGYTFQTQGDNNNVADNALVPEKNIYGKVIIKIPKLGYLQEFLASDGGWIIVILIPCLTVISYDVVKLIKGLKRKKYKNIKVQK